MNKPCMLLCRYIVLLVGCFIMLSEAQANVFPIHQSISYDNLPVKILEDATAQLSLSDVQTTSIDTQFTLWNKNDSPLKTNTTYWAKIELESQLPKNIKSIDWVMKIPVLSLLEAYIQLPDGTFERQASGRFMPLHQRSFVPTYEGNYIKFQLPAHRKISIYIRGKSERKMMPPSYKVAIQPLEHFYQNQQPIKTENALFLGFVVMMLMYNLISYFFGRHPSFLFYAGYLLTLGIYDSFISGCLMDWLPLDFFMNHPKYYYGIKLIIYPSLMCYMAFICSVLDLKKLLPYWHQLYKRFIQLGFLVLGIDILVTVWSNFSFPIADYVTVTYIFMFIIPSFLFIIPLYRSKSKLGFYILVGILAMTIGFLVSGLNRLFTIDFTLTPFRIGTILEIIAFSLGLAYRQRENERAKQQASFDLEKSEIENQQQEAERQRLTELDEFKNRFFTNITHEFRTPLTVIQGMAQEIDDHKHQRATELILKSNQELLNLVNQMLDLTKLESGKLPLQLSNGNIIDFLSQIVEDFKILTKQSEVNLTFETEAIEVEMAFDKEKLRQIITNLLTNALKFTDAGGQIILKVEKLYQQGDSLIKINLEDNGKGIDEKDLPHIFNRFYQVENAVESENLGSGIGLALTKELVHLMEGEIAADSQIGIGTTFTILLPIVEKMPDLIVEKANPNGAKPNNQKFNGDSLTPIITPLILLIEDNENVIEYLTVCLQKTYKIITATDGKTGVAMAINHQPALIISDIAMPEMDGYAVTKLLKNHEKTDLIPIILLTARATQAAKIVGLQHGADAYLFKPFDKEELLVRVAQLIASRKKVAEHFSTIQQIFPEIITDDAEDLEFLQKLTTLIEQQLDNEKLTVNALAKQLCMSRATLFRKVTDLTGKNVQEYLSMVRLQHAKTLLLTTNLRVSDVGFQVGFSSSAIFSKKYAKYFGYSPSKERKKAKTA